MRWQPSGPGSPSLEGRKNEALRPPSRVTHPLTSSSGHPREKKRAKKYHPSWVRRSPRRAVVPSEHVCARPQKPFVILTRPTDRRDDEEMASENRSMALGLGAVLLLMLSATTRAFSIIPHPPHVVQLSEAGYVIGTKTHEVSEIDACSNHDASAQKGRD